MQSRDLESLVVPAAFQGVLGRWLESRGVSVAQQGRSDPGGIKRGTIKWADWIEMVNSAVARVTGPVSGLEIGSLVTLRDFGSLGFLALQSRNFGDMLDTYSSLSYLFYGQNWGQQVYQGDRVRLVWHTPDSADRLVEQLLLTAAIKFWRVVVDEGVGPVAAWVMADECGEAELYEQAWGCPVVFSAPHAVLEYRREMRDRPISHAHLGIFEHAGSAGVDAELIQGVETVTGVWLEVQRQLPGGNLGVDTIASALGMSSRSLQRRLSEQNLSFREVLDAARRHLGRQLLRNPALSIKEIAGMLGYNQTSAFTHAYSRWYGQSPAKERRTLFGR